MIKHVHMPPSPHDQIGTNCSPRLRHGSPGAIDAVESLKAIMLGKYKMKDLGKIHLILGCEVLYDEATGDYSMNQRHYVIDLC